MGIAAQIAEREDNVLCSDVRGPTTGASPQTTSARAAVNAAAGASSSRTNASDSTWRATTPRLRWSCAPASRSGTSV
ncbi:hypothetical protein AVEN_102381-1 [Araneus ventricosus]|uniref:Uncharacterized protein n=1 Tax=Araneus ventricosus TaxID=182803 RepID=A0A4Y2S5U6_ARAVE|nr:hypothetical protein AVEN_102381-1 [Araneus ventricosus]